MRNSEFLDNPRPEDSLIGEAFIDKETGRLVRMVNGQKIIQSGKADHDLICNRVRASGMSPWDYLNM